MRNLQKLTLLTAMAVAALALSAGSAMAWVNPGNYTLTNTGGAANPLVSQVQIPGQPTISCNTVQFPAALDNQPAAVPAWALAQDAGQAPALLGGVPRLTNACTTSLPGCNVVVTTTGDWTIADNKLNLNNNVQVNFVRFDVAYTNAGGMICALNGATITVEGNVDATIAAGTGCGAGLVRTRATFNDADGLDVTSNVGIPRGTPVRLGAPAGFVETPCAATRPTMTP